MKSLVSVKRRCPLSLVLVLVMVLELLASTMAADEVFEDVSPELTA